MEDEPDLIRQQMQDRRTAMAEKLQALEEKVMGTVHSTTTAVTDTVAAVTESVAAVKDTVTDTVEAVKDGVQDAVSTVTDTVQDTVESVKSTFDFPSHFDRAPLLMVGGAVAAGFVAGRFLVPAASQITHRAGEMVAAATAASAPAWGDSGYRPTTPTWKDTGTPSSFASGGTDAVAATMSDAPKSAAAATGPAMPEWVSAVGEVLSDEANKLGQLALRTTLDVARDVVLKAVPPGFDEPARRVVDTLFSRLLG